MLEILKTALPRLVLLSGRQASISSVRFDYAFGTQSRPARHSQFKDEEIGG
jgi:hypothetical protein